MENEQRATGTAVMYTESTSHFSEGLAGPQWIVDHHVHMDEEVHYFPLCISHGVSETHLSESIVKIIVYDISGPCLSLDNA